ncbi:membrane-spanning 4-domains subfamily A member 4D-like [Chionomys nivalis]|uniref:membrane-spanning 4-domains subfamily A member 4D-like n=1 Tax=Chionomys nivalis TaxID=269649 RepID=UPI00259688CB|nr:membrane-spanning 4-domains subfamily A member 4D-like [Chionomys nivalis]XP_057635423.1 membrane-spanning 4-domains subfamily A member 4D-like [Chionomys nivalis]XP_057635424.1 membrane-spanning 4-domains subfamily A member 4D-like [Chionomys nivalis]
MQGLEQTTIEVAPEGALPSERSVVKSQLWKENAEKFLKGEPKDLGVVQVLIALINLILGIIMMSENNYLRPILSVYIYAPIWGSIVFIISGSLSIAAGMRTTEVLVTTSLSFNTISSVVAAATSIISVFSLPISLFERGHRILVGINALMLILNVLEFCIAVSTSAFGCKATCCNTSEVVVILPPNPAVSAAATPMLLQPLAPPVYQERNVPENIYKNYT